MDTTEAYRAARDRMIALVEGVDGSQAVPACPGWTVRDLLAHVTGVVDDILEGRMEGVATEEWTGAQVSSRAGRPVAEVTEEWLALGPRLDAAFDAIGGAPGQLVFDVVTHEHDLRHALRTPGGRDDGSVELALAWVAEAWAATASGTSAPLRLVAGDVTVTTGGGGEPGATVEMEPFEALRALTGRRSPAELLAYRWDVEDPARWLPCFAWGPFTVRDTPLGE
jgi:uncharacterized protein (TIGR03083 family)